MADKKEKDAADKDLVQSVIKEYETTKAFDEIARKCHISKVKVQRILITEGLWSSKRSRQVAELRDQGLSTQEIAERLGKDIRTVQTFLPYSRGQYGQEETKTSIIAKLYRERMNTAAEKMALKGNMTVNNELFVNKSEMNRKHMDASSKVVKEARVKKVGTGSVFRLKLELIDRFLVEDNGEFAADEEKQEFLRLAKAEKGIIREVLVPGEMNLHAMHYMIQRLFGWLNGHLHNFSLSELDFNALTGGKVGGWKNLCGSLLHFSMDEEPDMYWDDDYKPGQSVKTWYKNKYTGPYVSKATCDTYYDTRRAVNLFSERFPQFNPEMTLPEMHDQVVMEESLNYLIERLTIEELFANKIAKTKSERKRQFKQWIELNSQKMKETNALIDSISPRKREELNEAIDGLKRWRDNKSHVEQMIYMGREDDLFEQTGSDANEWIHNCNYFIPRFERKCKKLFAEYNPKLEPLFNTIYYEYDYGDGWCVKISIIEKYDEELISQQDEELKVLIDSVKSKQAPRCIASDGLNVLDDVGGIGGFHDMLLILEGDDQEEKQSTKSWARGLGWTGTLSKPELML